MPFIALDKSTRQRIDITQISNPREALSDNHLICPLCEEPLIIVAGLIRVHHFRHKEECTSDYGQHPESYEHLRTKLLVAQQAGNWFKEFTTATPQLEVPIPEVKRVADVLFAFPNGWRVACEIQLASITIEQLQQRTNDYLRAGIDVYWFLGKSAASDANLKWSIERFGFAFELAYKNNQLRVPFTTEPIEL